jgi:hypothetical protein
MKRFCSVTLVLIGVMLACAVAHAQDSDSVPPTSQSTDVPYRIFHTKNVYNVLELDTRDGRVWQVQWGDSGDRGHTAVNLTSLLPDGVAETVGRFTLYPTKNIWTFVLLDQNNGRTWQVQWGFKATERFIAEIK